MKTLIEGQIINGTEARALVAAEFSYIWNGGFAEGKRVDIEDGDSFTVHVFTGQSSVIRHTEQDAEIALTGDVKIERDGSFKFEAEEFDA